MIAVNNSASRRPRLGPNNITDDLEDREIGAARIHCLYLEWAHYDGAGGGIEGALRYELPKHYSELARGKASGS